MFVYLDNGATTRQLNDIKAEIEKINDEFYGNPSSLHKMGLKAEGLLKEARKSLGKSVGCKPNEIIFTGGGTEADNLALFGFYRANKRKGNKIISSKGEHPAVVEVCKELENEGAEVVYIDIDEYGNIDLDQLEDSLDETTILVSLIHVNNELGTISPLREIKKLIKGKSQAVFHTDSVQAYGKLPVIVGDDGADMASISSHKIHGPKGVGTLAVRQGLKLKPLIYGGGQENLLRAGTENLGGIYGFSLAAENLINNMEANGKKLHNLRNHLHDGIINEIKDIRVNTPMKGSSPAILNVSFEACPGEVLLHYLEEKDIYVSTGAACSSKKGGSRVLKAAGLKENHVSSAIRFSFSHFNTIEEIDYVIFELKKAVESIRKITKR